MRLDRLFVGIGYVLNICHGLTTFTLEAYTDAKNSFGEDIMTLGFSISGTSRNKTRRSRIRQSLVTPKMAPFPFYTGKGEDVEIVITELTPAGETALVKGPYSGKLTRFENPKKGLIPRSVDNDPDDVIAVKGTFEIEVAKR